MGTEGLAWQCSFILDQSVFFSSFWLCAAAWSGHHDTVNYHKFSVSLCSNQQ